MKTTFKSPQIASTAFNDYYTPKPTFATVEAVQVQPGTTMSHEELQTISRASTIATNTKIQSEITEGVHYIIKSELDQYSKKPALVIQIEIHYRDIRREYGRDGTPVSRYEEHKREGNTYRVEFFSKQEFLINIEELLLLADYTEKEPIKWLIDHFKNSVDNEKEIAILENKKNFLKQDSMFDFTCLKEQDLKMVEEAIFEKKSQVEQYKSKESNRKKTKGFLNYFKNNKAITAFDIFSGTLMWFSLFYLLGEFRLHHEPIIFTETLTSYFKFLGMQHLYSIPFFFATGFLSRVSTINYFKQYSINNKEPLEVIRRHFNKSH
ncbi:MAG: hypothetical protein K2W92_02720 [Alphaproteobacteria bacterium]|nr:hypothetical protein [Alphaproteobacteria bacterium]